MNDVLRCESNSVFCECENLLRISLHPSANIRPSMWLINSVCVRVIYEIDGSMTRTGNAEKNNRMLNYNKPRGPNLIMCLSAFRTFYSSIEVFCSWLRFVCCPVRIFRKHFCLLNYYLPLFNPSSGFVYVYSKCFDSFFWRRQQAPCMLIIIHIGDDLFIRFSQFK